MTLFNEKYRVETTRLRGYDYASAGWYFVTICTKDRGCFFGTVRSAIMGQVKEIMPWEAVKKWYPGKDSNLHGLSATGS